jgi:hypothetical protein
VVIKRINKDYLVLSVKIVFISLRLNYTYVKILMKKKPSSLSTNHRWFSFSKLDRRISRICMQNRKMLQFKLKDSSFHTLVSYTLEN